MKRVVRIRGLMVKDLVQMFRNKFVAAITLLSIVAYAGLFYAMPRTVDETFDIAVRAPRDYQKLLEKATEDEEAIKIEAFDSTAKMKEKVENGDYNAGIVLPNDFAKTLTAGKKPKVEVYYPPEVTREVKDGIELILKESAFALTGQQIPVGFSVKVLGTDRAGEQIPGRDRLKPFFIIFMLFMELWAIANLITEENESKTMNAILVSPASAGDVIISKGIVGTLLGFTEGALLAVLLGILKSDTAVILLTLFLGAMMVTGIAFIIGALAKDLIGMAGYAVLAMLVLIIPAFAVMFPGATSSWVKIFPGYYLVEILNQVVTYGESWVAYRSNLVILLVFDVAFFLIGASVLRRRFE